MCDRVAILHEGRVVEQGQTSQIVRDGEALEDAFIRLVNAPPAHRQEDLQ